MMCVRGVYVRVCLKKYGRDGVFCGVYVFMRVFVFQPNMFCVKYCSFV